MQSSHIELNEQFKRAYAIMEDTSRNVFITGKAGTGKSTLLSYFRAHTKKKVVFLAPTGVAALNIRGETIHSFFGFKPDITLEKVKRVKRRARIFKELDAIVIDEVSMVRADLVDCIDRFLRLNGKYAERSFGGVQMIFIGDLYQLPPVVTGGEREIFRSYYKSEYFFDALSFKDLKFEFIELEKVYRQKDNQFIGLLNEIRNNSVSEESLSILNSRVIPDYMPDYGSSYTIFLTTTNKMADDINMENLSGLNGRVYEFKAQVEGAFDRRTFPASLNLTLKNGAQVMMLNNDRAKRWVNGSIGKVDSIAYSEDEGAYAIYIRFPTGNVEAVYPYTWDMFHYIFNRDTGLIDTENIGSFTQYPVKLAFAITIHKSQGKTFDNVVIDIGKGTFAHGQIYVALSRCTSFNGIVLKRPVKKQHIFMDWRIVKFLVGKKYKISEEEMPLSKKIAFIEKAIKLNMSLDIVYLKTNDVTTRRIVIPKSIEEKEYMGRKFTALVAHCTLRRQKRIFRVDRILNMQMVPRGVSDE